MSAVLQESPVIVIAAHYAMQDAAKAAGLPIAGNGRAALVDVRLGGWRLHGLP